MSHDDLTVAPTRFPWATLLNAHLTQAPSAQGQNLMGKKHFEHWAIWSGVLEIFTGTIFLNFNPFAGEKQKWASNIKMA